jgi:hypothetical protein
MHFRDIFEALLMWHFRIQLMFYDRENKVFCNGKRQTSFQSMLQRNTKISWKYIFNEPLFSINFFLINYSNRYWHTANR